MFKSIIAASVSVMLLCLASAASAKTACEETADTQYAIAVAIDYDGADMVHEDAMTECEDAANDFAPDSDPEFRAWLRARIIAETEATSDARRWRLESLDFSTRCPNGHYDYANDVDVCE